MKTIGEFLERFGKTLFEAPLSGPASSAEIPPELAEIRLAVLDRIREKSYRSGGRKVFPYDLLHVRMQGVEESRRDLFAGRFFRQYIEQEVRAALRDGGCRFPENLRVEIEVRVGLPLPGEQWLVVEIGSQEKVNASRIGRLIVREGAANVGE